MSSFSSSESHTEGIETTAAQGTSTPVALRKRSVHLDLPPLLLCIAALAFCLRIWGITWGLPNERQVFSLHPDEGVNLLEGVLTNGEVRPHLDLRLYNYGSLYFYAWQAVAEVNRVWGIVSLPESGVVNQVSPVSTGSVILLGRLLSVLAGVMTCLLLYAAGRNLYGKRAGLIAAGIHAVMPLAVLNSHFATVDVFACFFIAGTVWITSRLLAGFTWKLLAYAGIWTGLASASKYNAGLVLIAPLVVIAMDRGTKLSIRVARIASLLLIAGVVFTACCPGPLINPQEFWSDFQFELEKTRTGMGYLFADTGNGWWYHLAVTLRWGIGVPLEVMGIMAMAILARKEGRVGLPFALFALVYFAIAGSAQVRFARYMLPMLIPMCLALGGWLGAKQLALGRARAIATAGWICGISGLLVSISYAQLFAASDPRSLALDAIRMKAPMGSTVGFATVPWYDSPQFSLYFTHPSPPVRYRSAGEVKDYQLRLPEPGTEYDLRIFDARPAAVVVSDIGSSDAIRIGLPAAKEFIKRLEKDYSPRVFENPRSLLGMRIAKPQHLPNDLMYIQPRITVYFRRDLSTRS